MPDARQVLERISDRADVPQPAFERLLRRRDRKERNRRIGAGIAAFLVFGGASFGLAWALLRGDSPRPAGPAPAPDVTGPPAEATPAPSPSPTTGGVGFVGLPPEGLTPSTPEHAEVIWRLGSTLEPGLWVSLYADGRLIWVWNHGVPSRWMPYAASESTTGLLERRLTREGMKLLGSVIIRSPSLNRIDELLLDPLAWLPASAWEDLEIRPYVPSRFAVCPYELSEQFRQPRIVRELPEQAADLLRASDRLPGTGCYDVTTDDARAIATSLEGVGFERLQEGSAAQVLEYLAAAGGTEIHVSFNPIMPDGWPLWLQFG